MLRVIERDERPTPASGQEIMTEIVELLERRLPDLPLDDPIAAVLRDLYDGLRERGVHPRRGSE